MTKEEKELLLKDLCARLPYGVKVDVNFYDSIKELSCDLIQRLLLDEKSLRPYLRPMSSMTEEEKKELRDKNILIAISTSGTVETTINGFDWLNKKGFDYRGLILMGLALEAPEEMYQAN